MEKTAFPYFPLNEPPPSALPLFFERTTHPHRQRFSATGFPFRPGLPGQSEDRHIPVPGHGFPSFSVRNALRREDRLPFFTGGRHGAKRQRQYYGRILFTFRRTP